MNKLSVLEEKFVEGIVVGKTSTRAAIDAGYAPKNAANRASKLHRKAKIQAAITLRRSSAVAAAEQATNISLARLFEELGRTALNDPKDILDADGNVLPLHEIPEHARRAIASVEVTTHEVERSGTQGAKNRTTVALARTTKIKFWDKLKAIEQIARLAGYLKEESTEGGEYILRWADE